MSYRCLSRQEFRQGDRRLVPWREQDIESVRRWRNEQIDVLRQKQPLTEAQQSAYYRGTISPTFQEATPKQVLFSYLEGERLIGYGGLVHIDWEVRRGEVSFLVETSRAADPVRYTDDFRRYFGLLARAAFEDLGFRRLTSETFDIRPLHVEVLESLGFRREGRLRKQVMVNGSPVDSLLHGLLRDEWTPPPGL